MKKRKKWQGVLIISVIFLTLYNIFPTIFYYANPLDAPIDEKRAFAISTSILNRINVLEEEAEAWLKSFCKTLRLKSPDICIDTKDPALFRITFKMAQDAARFHRAFPKAGSLIPFSAAQLSLVESQEGDDRVVFVQRRIPIHFASNQPLQYFFVEENDGGQRVLKFNLLPVANAYLNHLKHTLRTAWHPLHPDLKQEALPIVDYNAYHALPEEQQHFGLILCAPLIHEELEGKGLRRDSLYVIAKGMVPILERIKRENQENVTAQFLGDIQVLQDILHANGYASYAASDLGLPQEFAQDLLFEIRHYYRPILLGTREDFHIDEDASFATLILTDLKQRLLTENRIESRVHEDLLKWRDDYQAAQLNLRGLSQFDVPKPTKSALIENFLLSVRKYFRGDERKILHWGLDLSGGKIVDIELRDEHGRVVKEEKDIALSINELYERVHNMGLAEVTIRREGNRISLAFPGKQALSAADLVKASKMTFHILNEQFGSLHPELAATTDRFLQEVWNEAILTNCKEVEAMNEIARKLLYGDESEGEARPRSEAARMLYERGLRLARPGDAGSSSEFNDSLSKIVIWRGSESEEWEGRTHPLMIAFASVALEGSYLKQIRTGYDPNHGNFLSFEVKRSVTEKGTKFSPRDHFHMWTSHFAKDQIIGTPLEQFSTGRGWRMAAILNDRVISAPELKEPLRDSGMISGQFTQRTISQLESDLRAGSLHFTPHILSEKNISPELGVKERWNGIVATMISLVLVIALMIAYYRFVGSIAACALILNLFIIWAVYQNLGAVLTLPGIASIVLTLGMAVDANVLVFERVREEFAQSKRVASAIEGGYRKAFSAIFDSNLTTMIAAIALLQFNCGPVKSFAIALIIGIASSMFTALFMTRYYFTRWVQKTERKRLSMRNWFQIPSVDFLKRAKWAFGFSCVIICLGSVLVLSQRSSFFGMDVSGGYAFHLELDPSMQGGYRQGVERALISAGISPQDMRVRELSPKNVLRIDLSRKIASTTPSVKKDWIVQALEKGGLSLNKSSSSDVEQTWVEVTGQFSQTMRRAVALSFSLALLAILLYIAFRFEWPYAISATLCIIHDVLFTLGMLALLHFFGVGIQIDLITIAALLTIVGYSLNDTIIIFDRIREEMRLQPRAPFRMLINHALNATLSRTIMTSGTTFLVLVPLLFLGGSTLFQFALVMAIGIFFGTLSSLLIAAPLLLAFLRNRIRVLPVKEA